MRNQKRAGTRKKTAPDEKKIKVRNSTKKTIGIEIQVDLKNTSNQNFLVEVRDNQV